MKLRKSGQVLMATVVSAGLTFSIAACGVSHTVDFVFVTASKGNATGIGQINSYAVDSGSGALTQVQDSPFLSGGRDPVAEATSPNGQNLYVINQLDNTVVQFQIGSDGKLYPTHTVNTPGSEPTALAVSPDGAYLFVTDNYQAANPVYTDSNPGPGGLIIFPLDSTGAPGTPIANGNTSFWPLPFSPVGIKVEYSAASVAQGSTPTTCASNCFVYVVSKSGATAGTNGLITAFSVGSGGALTTVPGSPFAAGTTPNAIATDPTSRFVYVTDGAANQLLSYGTTSTGALVPQVNGPTATGGFPDAVTVSPQGTYIFIANYNDPSIMAFAIDQATGNPSSIATGGTYAARTGPTCVLIDPALGRFLYISNFLDNTITGLQVNTNSGAMEPTQGPDYAAAPQPTCVSAVTHGNHAIQHTQS